MHLRMRSILGLFLGLGLLVTAFAADRVVVCEYAYSEG